MASIATTVLPIKAASNRGGHPNRRARCALKHSHQRKKLLENYPFKKKYRWIKITGVKSVTMVVDVPLATLLRFDLLLP